ncbi:MAG: VOC family protein [Pyrinomonadaceae bacterium]
MSITPYLLYEDVDAALKFLSKAFGFRRRVRPMRGPDGKINHAAMELGDGVIMMGYPGGGYRNPKRLRQSTQSLYVNVDDVDKHYQRAKKGGRKNSAGADGYKLRAPALWR